MRAFSSIGMKSLIPALVFVAATPALALDIKDKDVARTAAGLLVVTMLCPDYKPLPDVMRFLANRSVGEDRAKQIMLAVGAEFRRLGKHEDVPERDPEISAVVDEDVDTMLGLYENDQTKACHDLGEVLVKTGVAELKR